MNLEQSGTSTGREHATSAPWTPKWLGMPRAFALAVAALGVAITATVVPAPFLIDDLNYLVNVTALRQGHVTVPNTAGLTPSSELTFFDPVQTRVVTSTPVGSTAPPLYGLLALPFAWLGWRGLVAINTLAYLITTVMVFRYARRHSTGDHTPWLAAAAFALGGFSIEYAQGLWPHALSIALVTAGVLLVAIVLDGAHMPAAASAGFLLALATGVRYQNAVILSIAGLALLLWAPRRWRASLSYGAAACVPLAISALINHARLGWWNPVSKGPGYLTLPVVEADGSAFDPLLMFWARLVDSSVRPPLIGADFVWVKYDVVSGAHLIFGTTVQKAFVQSAPWACLALVLFVLVWVNRAAIVDRQRAPLRLFSLIVFALLMTFAASGRWRHEGASYNQRYLLELVPFVAIAFAWSLDRFRIRPKDVLGGSLWGVLAAVTVLLIIPLGSTRWTALLKAPVVLGLLLALALWLARRGLVRVGVLAGMAGACLGWACTLHLADDVIASRTVRLARLRQSDILMQTVPDNAALVAYWGAKDASGPLVLARDVVVLDAHNDDGATAPGLVRELLMRGRRVFVFRDGMPNATFTSITSGLQATRQGPRLVELELTPASVPHPVR